MLDTGVDPPETAGLTAAATFPNELITNIDCLEMELIGAIRTF